MITDVPGAGTPVLVVHGLGCTSTADYRTLAEALSGRRLLLADLCLAEDPDAPDDHTIEGLARYLDQRLTGRGIARVVLFGHSAGGAIALSLARLAPARVAGVFLTECNLDPGGGDYSRRIAGQSKADFVAQGFAGLIAEQRRECPTHAATLEVSAPAALHRESQSLVAGTTPTWRDIMYDLTCPRTYVFSESALPDPDVAELPRHGVQVAIIPSAGHNMAYDNPAALAETFERFLADLDPQPPTR